jgi:hypothetical protein
MLQSQQFQKARLREEYYIRIDISMKKEGKGRKKLGTGKRVLIGR